jgi:hypothetical protein
VDFTTKTDADILAHFRGNEGKICGRFRPDQLGRPLLRASYLRRSGLTAAAASVSVLLAAQQPTPASQVEQQAVVHVLPNGAPVQDSVPAAIKKGSIRIISGQIVDALTNDPLPFVSVSVKNTKLGASTQLDGTFRVSLPIDLLEQNVPALFISYTGYQSQDIPLPLKVLQEDIALPIRLEYWGNGALMGDIIVVKPGPIQRVRRFFQRLFN